MKPDATLPNDFADLKDAPTQWGRPTEAGERDTLEGKC